MTDASIDQLAVDTLRTLSIDQINRANSGHPGLPMGAAPMAYTLWSRVMRHNPENPKWFDRDRFVLSAGHGSALLYSLLNLFGYGLSIEDLKQFRQLGSKTPGHPEYGVTDGVEATTGPLGQGFGMAVGMAMAEAHLSSLFNRPAYPVINHHTYVLCGDGDLMEGVSSESASLAGHLKLGKLIVLYDSNHVSLDGMTDMSFTEDVRERFRAYHWQTLVVEDGNNLDAIEKALCEAQSDINHPTLIEVRTIIGYGVPNGAGTHLVHGSPLGEKEAERTKKGYGWDHAPFYVPEEVAEKCAKVLMKGACAERQWHELMFRYASSFPKEYSKLTSMINGETVAEVDFPKIQEGTEIATRNASGKAIQSIKKKHSELFGGAADLFESVKTYMDNEGDFQASNYCGRNIWFGVREFAMACAVNGMTLHGGIKAYGSTFFMFSDYMKPAIRLAALMKIPSIFVFTHDSIAVGEDGPTHEPIEQLAGLRAIPNLTVLRPADSVETNEAWKIAMKSTERPTLLVLTRQNTKTYDSELTLASLGVERGGYIISPAKGKQESGVLIATGSEVGLALEAQKILEKRNIFVRVVSMPAFNLFNAQSKEYRDTVLPPSLTKCLGIEMGSSFGWHQYVGRYGALLTIDRFGASGKGSEVTALYGFTPENAAKMMMDLIKTPSKQVNV